MTDKPFPSGSKVVAYFRDSGGMDQEMSVTQQEANVRLWCQQHNYVIAKVYSDVARSGGSVDGRDSLEQMIQDLGQSTDIAGVVVWSYSRLFRNLDDALFYLALLRREGVGVYSITDPVPDGVIGRMVEMLHLYNADAFRRTLSKDVIRGQHDMINRYGAWQSGRFPIGYKFEQIQVGVRRDGRPRYIRRPFPDPELAPLVRLAFQMRSEGRTYGEIHAATGLQKSVQGYYHLLRNPIYAGMLKWGDLLIENYCEPIVDREIFDRCQTMAKLSGEFYKENYHPRRVTSPYLLSGLARCGLCGRVMIAKSARQGRLVYYRCTAAYTSVRTCTAKGVHRERLDRMVLDTLHNFLTNPQNLAELFVEAQSLADQEQDVYKAHQSTLQKELDDVNQQVGRVTSAIVAAGHSKALLDKLADLERRQIELEQALSQLTLPAPGPSVDPVEYAERASVAWAAIEGANLRDKQVFLRGLVDCVVARTVDEGGLYNRPIVGEIVLRPVPGLTERMVVIPL